MKRIYLSSLFVVFFVTLIQAQQSDYRPELFFREDFTEEPKRSEIPLAQKHVSNPELMIDLFGSGKDSLSKSHHAKPLDDPYYVWSGRANGNWMVSLKHKSENVDLTGYAKIKWRTKQSGFRQLRITIKLADGTWLVSDVSDDKSDDWRVREFNVKDISWFSLDVDNLTELRAVLSPDLSNVEAIGFTDLMRGGGSLACSRLDRLEVYGVSVKR